MHCPQDVRLGRLAHGVLLIIGQSNHVLPLVAKELVQVCAHVLYIVDATTKLSSLAEVVDADEQRLAPTSASRVLKCVSLWCTVSKVLCAGGRWWGGLRVSVCPLIATDGGHHRARLLLLWWRHLTWRRSIVVVLLLRRGALCVRQLLPLPLLNLTSKYLHCSHTVVEEESVVRSCCTVIVHMLAVEDCLCQHRSSIVCLPSLTAHHSSAAEGIAAAVGHRSRSVAAVAGRSCGTAVLGSTTWLSQARCVYVYVRVDGGDVLAGAF
jgi:hypothetical protein